jgi:hypothetical protein
LIKDNDLTNSQANIKEILSLKTNNGGKLAIFEKEERNQKHT